MKIIAFSVYSVAARYWVGALQNALLAHQHFPGWICRFYVDRKNNFTLPIEQMGHEVVLMGRNTGCRGMFWRFLAASDPQASHIIFRDTDSRLSRAEASAVQGWVDGDFAFHIIKAHPNHAGFKMLGGLWGVKGGVIPNMPELISQWGKWDQPRGQDQEFLEQVIWPMAQNGFLLSASNLNGKAKEFHGQPFSETGQPLA